MPNHARACEARQHSEDNMSEYGVLNMNRSAIHG